ncbi:FAD-binding oxidoreductase [Megasphaera hominis]|jgi:glycolate oxidase|uniref:FAD-binding oxidoreductase n=1 Tax=Megasphaera hominis TaxID=159836 RepID=A0ABR6VF90_9FIRM|nr:FAD-binding oxidoreductase [Megasphaera hominis]MBC3535804.1 FAD-binding oxidoreductase [Megasphaera hominis]
MSRYNKVSKELLDELLALLGKHNMTVDPEKLDTFKTDEETNPIYFHTPEVVVFPESTEQVAGVMKLANKYKVPVTPRGGGSSLACGAIPVYNGIVLCLEKMNKVLEVNADALYMIAEAGTITTEVQAAAKAAGLYYAGDPSSKASSEIGGNISTNAGGSRVVKYGTTRDQVYWLEIVTPTGEITRVGKRLQKNTTGYALEKLICGCEGTLGIVTKVCLKLRPIAPFHFDLVGIFKNVNDALAVPNQLQKAGVQPTAIEFLNTEAIQSAERFLGLELPYSKEDGNYIIVTVDSYDQDDLDNRVATADEICQNNHAAETLVADERIWNARYCNGEAARNDSRVFLAEDIVVPIDKIPDLVAKLPEIKEKYGITTNVVAHIGDGNIHVNAMKMDMPLEKWNEIIPQYHDTLYTFVYSLGGCLSGEHGIGLRKIAEMKKFTDPVELGMMEAIKKALDPNLILNPSKIFDFGN